MPTSIRSPSPVVRARKHAAIVAIAGRHPSAQVAHRERSEDRRTATGPEHSGVGLVVDIVTGYLGERPIGAVPGNRAVDDGRADFTKRVVSDTQAVGNAGTEPFQDGVGVGHQGKDLGDAVVILQVDDDACVFRR